MSLVAGRTRLRLPRGSIGAERLGEQSKGTSLLGQARTVIAHGGYETQVGLKDQIMTLQAKSGIPTLTLTPVTTLQLGDIVALDRAVVEDSPFDQELLDWALFAGGFASEGWSSGSMAGYDNTEPLYFEAVLAAWERLGGRYNMVGEEVTCTGEVMQRLRIPRSELVRSPVDSLLGKGPYDKHVPEFIWEGGAAVRRAFLQTLWTGDGSLSLLPRNTIQLSYSTYSRELLQGVRQLLLEFGIASRVTPYEKGEYKLYISNRRDARLYAKHVGCVGAKQDKLEEKLSQIPLTSTAMSHDHIPFLAEYVREATRGQGGWKSREWLKRHNIDRHERWERDAELISSHIRRPEVLSLVEELFGYGHYYVPVRKLSDPAAAALWDTSAIAPEWAGSADGFLHSIPTSRLRHGGENLSPDGVPRVGAPVSTLEEKM